MVEPMYTIESLTGSRQVVLNILYSCSGQFTMRQICPRTKAVGFAVRLKTPPKPFDKTPSMGPPVEWTQ